jgi:hypothetical protein
MGEAISCGSKTALQPPTAEYFRRILIFSLYSYRKVSHRVDESVGASSDFVAGSGDTIPA